MKNRTRLVLLGALIAIPVAWYLISPLFINRQVNEAFPTAQASDSGSAAEASAAPGMQDEPALGPTAMAEATQAMEEAMAEPTKAMDDPMPEDDPAAMAILLQGSFYNIAHEGMGTATIYQLADGSRVLRFEGFEVLNGPDLHVYLSSQDPVPNTVGVELEGSLDLGELKGNIGDQNYEIPAGLDLSQFHSVVIWCQPFRVPFSAASVQVPVP